MRTGTVLAGATLIALTLTACTPGALAPADITAPPPTGANPTPSATTGPAEPTSPASASPTTTPEAPEPTIPDGWEEVTVDNWVTLQIPSTWNVEPDPLNADDNASFIIDEQGNKQVWLLRGTEGQYAADNCAPENVEFIPLSATPVPAAGEDIVFGATITPVYIGTDDAPEPQKRWMFEAGLTHPDLIAPGDCTEPFYALYDDEAYMAVKIQADPEDALHFKTEAEARAYETTEEYQTLSRIITSAEVLN